MSTQFWIQCHHGLGRSNITNTTFLNFSKSGLGSPVYMYSIYFVLTSFVLLVLQTLGYSNFLLFRYLGHKFLIDKELAHCLTGFFLLCFFFFILVVVLDFFCC